jgi:DNA repair photolyase
MKEENSINDSAVSESFNAAGSTGPVVQGNKLNYSPLPDTHPDNNAPARSLHDREKRKVEARLEKLKPVSFINSKPVFVIPSTTVINFNSGFGHKLLCDFLTFTAGSACVFTCAFCYVIAILRKNKWIQQILRETGLKFPEIVVRRQHPVESLRKKLAPRGKPKFTDPADKRVIYASPLVDIAASMELAKETTEMCLAILELTHWQIRLLSKSPLILKIAEQIPNRYQHRMIYGLSTGTLDVGIAKAIEQGTGLVSKRLEALHTLQDRGLRTYGMVCPILPQADPAAYAAQVVEAIRVDRCEHVWAEVMNVRGSSFTATHEALGEAGYYQHAELLAQLSHSSERREEYARETFLALAKVIPARKFRFLQYVNKHSLAWWADHEHQGAVLLGKAAKHATHAKTLAVVTP